MWDWTLGTPSSCSGLIFAAFAFRQCSGAALGIIFEVTSGCVHGYEDGDGCRQGGEVRRLWGLPRMGDAV